MWEEQGEDPNNKKAYKDIKETQVSATQLEVGTSTSSALNCRIIITLSNHDSQHICYYYNYLKYERAQL